MNINLNFEKSSTIAGAFNKYNLSTEKIEPCSHSSYIHYEGGVPVASTTANMVAIDHTDSHTIVFGSTGSKKTRLVVMPTVKILGTAGESMIINDTKGELYHRFEGELSARGYQIIVLDLRDARRGNCWNPLDIPYEIYLKGDVDKAAELVNDIATNLMINKNYSNHNLDPYWDFSAADCFFGLTLLFFKFCKEHNVAKGDVNISNLLSLRRKLFANASSKEYDEDLWKYAQEDELIAASLSGTITAGERTKASILSIFDQNMRTFVIQPTLLDMLSRTDFSMERITENKTALFLITPDEKSSYHRLVSLFVKQSYEYLINIAMQNLAGKVNIRLNYILDEFGALPAITDMNSMIAAARSRNIRFLLVTQSKHQLIEHYGDSAQTIIANCNNWIFLTSRELELLQELSQLCGDNERKLPNLSVFDLQHFNKERGEALLLCGRFKPCKIFLPDINEYYHPDGCTHKIEFVAAKEVPLRKLSGTSRIDFSLKNNDDNGIFDNDDELFKDNDEDISDITDNAWDMPKLNLTEGNEKSTEELAKHYGNFIVDLAKEIKEDDDRIREAIAECTNFPKEEEDCAIEDMCMDIIEKIVSISKEQNRDEAIREAAKELIVIRQANIPQLISMHKRVLHEFIICTEKEYNLLKKQIFVK